MRICKTVLVAGRSDIAEEISRAFRKRDVYFSAFESPDNFNEAHGVFHNKCVKISNAAKTLLPETIIMAACSERAKQHFRDSFIGFEIIEIDEMSEAALSRFTGYRHPNMRREITVYTHEDRLSGNTIVVDPKDDFTLVISKNLAIAMQADLVVLPNIESHEIDRLRDLHYLWNSATDTLTAADHRNTLFETLKARLGNLFVDQPRSISFVTPGIPYGLLPFRVPTTHLLNYPCLLGTVIAKGISKTYLNIPRVPLAVLVAPDAQVAAEVQVALNILGNDGYLIRTANGPAAQAYRVSMLVEHLPYDILIFSSHAGEVQGDRVTLEFENPPGTIRRLVYDSVPTFNLIPGTDQVHLVEFKRYVSFDGVPWPIRNGEPNPDLCAAFAHYMANINNHEFGRKTRAPNAAPIRGSGVFKMADFNYAPVMHECGGYNSPVVIANACSTWRDTVDRFVPAGASVYIGTAQDIPNPIATEVLPELLRKISGGQPLAFALAESQREFVNDLDYSPYLMEGFIFTRLPPAPQKNANPNRVQSAISRRIASHQLGLANPAEAQFRHANERAIEFFEQELTGLRIRMSL